MNEMVRVNTRISFNTRLQQTNLTALCCHEIASRGILKLTTIFNLKH
ncbi:MAG: hypothetical protein ACI8ZM_002725 [Crocinitomix sp.]|jgi:hypothetical protein